jgi:hypothetical protein
MGGDAHPVRPVEVFRHGLAFGDEITLNLVLEIAARRTLAGAWNGVNSDAG